jgi:hypothetical protein
MIYVRHWSPADNGGVLSTAKEEDIRSDASQMRTFGTKHVICHLVKLNEEWKISFSAEE